MESNRKITRTRIVRKIKGNISDCARRENEAQMIEMGIPKNIASDHAYAQSIEIKQAGDVIYIRSRYVYYSFPSTSGEANSHRTLIQGGAVVSHVASQKSSDGSWETVGQSHDRGRDADSFDLSDDEGYCDSFDDGGDGARDFDRCAHKVLRGEARIMTVEDWRNEPA